MAVGRINGFMPTFRPIDTIQLNFGLKIESPSF